MDRNQNTVTSYFNDEKTYSSRIIKLSKRCHHYFNQLYEFELVKPEIEHKETFIVEFYILQCDK